MMLGWRWVYMARVSGTFSSSKVRAMAGDKLMVMINGAGATTLMEMYILLRACGKILQEKGIEMACSEAGEILTVQEMAGFQMFVAKMDDELLNLWSAPCDTPLWTVR